MRNIAIMGGLGIISSAVIRHLMNATEYHLIVIDSMTYAAMLEAISEFADSLRYIFKRGDICDRSLFLSLLNVH